MKRTLLFLVTIVCAISVFAQTQTIRTLTWDGTERQYIEIVPANNSIPKPVMFFLHGLGDNMNNFKDVISNDAADWYFIVPQATLWSINIPVIGSMDIGEAWNVGATASGLPYVGSASVNNSVDDSGFLMAILDSLQNNLNIDTDSIFFCGFSLGGFMTNRMGIEHSDRISGIASVSGTKGNNIPATPTNNILALHIHGTADGMINYETGNFNGTMWGQNVNSPLGLGAEANVEYWRNFNNCDAASLIYDYPNLINDGTTFKRYYYLNGNNNSRVAFIKVEDGVHTWYQSELQHDIDFHKEMVKFFRGQWDTQPISINDVENSELTVYPNPAVSNININMENEANLDIYNIIGEKVLETKLTTGENNINISNLKTGMYFIKINDNKNVFEQKLTIQ